MGRTGLGDASTAASRTGARAKAKREALKSLVTHIENQDDRLGDDRFRAAGVDIGSGRVEAVYKPVVAVRIRHRGSKAGSQNVLSLRVAWLREVWDRLWDTHPLARAA